MHPQMALSIEECVQLSHLKEKITAVIPTYSANINCLMWSVFSLLLRSKTQDLLEHICVCVNGADSRTGPTAVQDEKQLFLEELRDIEWYHGDQPRRPMPLTVIRAWSRVGWSESLEMALPWVHTDAYMLMHDDAFVTTPDWAEEVRAKFYGDDNVALAGVPPLLGCKTEHHVHRGMYLLRLPQLQTTFLVVKKKWVMKAKATWTGYHIPSDDNVLQFDMSDLEDAEGFFKFWRDQNLLSEPFMTSEMYNFVRQEVGAWVYYNLYRNGHAFAELRPDLVVHLEKMSWNEPPDENGVDPKNLRIESHRDKIAELEALIDQHPEYSALYRKYKKG